MPSRYMARIGELDLPDRLFPAVPRWATQCGVALLCVGAAGLLRFGINVVAPGAAVFALVYPKVSLQQRLEVANASGRGDQLTIEYLKVFLKAKPVSAGGVQ